MVWILVVVTDVFDVSGVRISLVLDPLATSNTSDTTPNTLTKLTWNCHTLHRLRLILLQETCIGLKKHILIHNSVITEIFVKYNEKTQASLCMDQKDFNKVLVFD